MPKDRNQAARPSATSRFTNFLRRRVRAVQGAYPVVKMRANVETRLNAVFRPGLYSSVHSFCLFIGHGRSGSTLVGALLNAHRNVVLSNELDVLHYAERGLPRNDLFNHVRLTARSQARHGSTGGGGYAYAVPDQWQGRHDHIHIIGDRKAGATAIQLYRNPELLRRLQDVVQLPLRFVCVVRNPFDSLTTTFKRTSHRATKSGDEYLRALVETYFNRWAAVEFVFNELGEDHVIFVRHDAVLEDTESRLAELCEFLRIDADPGYLASCAGIVRRKPSITRHSPECEWPSDLIDDVHERMSKLRWLEGYAWDSSP